MSYQGNPKPHGVRAFGPRDSPGLEDHQGPLLLEQRRGDAWVEVGLGRLRKAKQRLGGTINDAVLTAVAGALGRYLRATPRSAARWTACAARGAPSPSRRSSSSTASHRRA